MSRQHHWLLAKLLLVYVFVKVGPEAGTCKVTKFQKLNKLEHLSNLATHRFRQIVFLPFLPFRSGESQHCKVIGSVIPSSHFINGKSEVQNRETTWLK